MPTAEFHHKCRNTAEPYAKSDVHRIKVPDEKVDWNVEWKDYSPPDYTSPSLKGKPYADGEIEKGKFKWNEMDGKVDRRSHHGHYKVADDHRPLNPRGRTGLKGHGVLGKWGPNHAADCIVSRIHNDQLQFIAIQRQDTGAWAVPGGMIDSAESALEAAKREFVEEAMENVKNSDLDSLWQKEAELYRGYVDDPRNTDNAWMETVAFNFHDGAGILKDVKFKAGDDAVNVQWLTATPLKEKLYASHEDFIKILVKRHGFS